MNDARPPIDLGGVIRGSGPTEAPPGLLDRVIAGTATTSQRPGALAAAMGVPTMSRRRELRGAPIRLVVVGVALLTAMLVGAMAMAGAFTRTDSLVVLATIEPSGPPSATPGPTFSFVAQHTPIPLGSGPVATPEPQTYVDEDAGFWFTGTGTFPYSFGTFARGGCVVDFCPAGVRVTSGPAGAPMAVTGADGGETEIAATSLKQARAALRALEPDGTPEAFTIDGQAAVVITSSGAGGRTVAITFLGGRMYVLRAYSMFGNARIVLNEFLGAFHLLPGPCWLRPCEPGETAGADEAWAGVTLTKMRGSWHTIVPEAASPTTAGGLATRMFSGGDMGAGFFGDATVSIGTTTTGVPLPESMLRSNATSEWVRGTSLDELEASWRARVGTVAVGRGTLDGVEALTIRASELSCDLVIHRGMVIAVCARGLTHFDLDSTGALARFLSGVSLLP